MTLPAFLDLTGSWEMVSDLPWAVGTPSDGTTWFGIAVIAIALVGHEIRAKMKKDK